jgi:hypothetical protein
VSKYPKVRKGYEMQSNKKCLKVAFEMKSMMNDDDEDDDNDEDFCRFLMRYGKSELIDVEYFRIYLGKYFKSNLKF